MSSVCSLSLATQHITIAPRTRARILREKSQNVGKIMKVEHEVSGDNELINRNRENQRIASLMLFRTGEEETFGNVLNGVENGTIINQKQYKNLDDKISEFKPDVYRVFCFNINVYIFEIIIQILENIPFNLS